MRVFRPSNKSTVRWKYARCSVWACYLQMSFNATGSSIILLSLNHSVYILIKATTQKTSKHQSQIPCTDSITYSKSDTDALQFLLLDWYLLNIWCFQSSRCLRPCFAACLSLCSMSLLGIRENCCLILGWCNTMTYLTRGVGAAPDTPNATCKWTTAGRRTTSSTESTFSSGYRESDMAQGDSYAVHKFSFLKYHVRLRAQWWQFAQGQDVTRSWHRNCHHPDLYCIFFKKFLFFQCSNL